MSKLIDIFKRESGAANQPMGFRTSRQSQPVKTLALIAVVPVTVAAAPEGADALLVRPGKTRLTARSAQAVAAAAGDIPWGIADSGDKASALPDGCDYVIFPAAGLTSAAPDGDEIGCILEVDSTMDEGLLASVNDLPVDAVCIADAALEGPLVWHNLMILRRVINLIDKPVIVPVPAGISPEDLAALWEHGVDGIIVEAEPPAIATLREAIGKLPPRSAHKRDRQDALLPRLGASSVDAEPDEEEEWE